MASAKDTRRTSVIADLQDTLELQKQELEQLRQSQKQKQPSLKEDKDDDDNDDSDSDKEDKGHEKEKEKEVDNKEKEVDNKEKEALQERVLGLETQLAQVCISIPCPSYVSIKCFPSHDSPSEDLLLYPSTLMP